MRQDTSLDLLIVATCSYGKKVAPPPELKIRSLPSGSIATRVQEWSTRLETTSAERTPARDLYKGDHWTAVRELEVVGSSVGLRAEMWIASAGYGLIPMNAEIAAYGATFAPDQQDYVLDRTSTNKKTASSEWWSRITSWRGPMPRVARSLTELAEQHSNTPMLVIVSQPYARALELDLLGASGMLDSSKNLSIVSIGLESSSPLAEFVLPGDARFSTWLGGTLTSVNARVGKAIVERVHEWGLTRGGIGRGLSARLEDLDPYAQPKRESRGDDEVRTYIRTALEENPTTTHSRLLRSFRAEGYACAQDRFRRLYEDVRRTDPENHTGIEGA